VGDAFYFCLRSFCYPIVWVSSRPTVLHRERVPRKGAMILAANHLSPFDIPCLFYASPRPLDFVSVTEVFQHKFTAWLYGSMNAFPLDRHRPDTATVRTIHHRLEHGRAIAMFPEGSIRTPQTSLLSGAPFKPGVAGLARLTGAPVVPCVVLGTRAYGPIKSFLPLRSVRWGAIFGEPMRMDPDGPEQAARESFVAALRANYDALFAELRDAMGFTSVA
jgi:1-acyl-sn-glycerol-3-phosphate acyltransferase